jgi:hypothetical protein
MGAYDLVDDLLKGIGHLEDPRRKFNDSELITTTMVSALYFGGHHDNARSFMKITGLCQTAHLVSRCDLYNTTHPVIYSLFSTFAGLLLAAINVWLPIITKAMNMTTKTPANMILRLIGAWYAKFVSTILSKNK